MARKKTRGPTSLQFLHDRYIGSDPKRLASLEKERANAQIAWEIYELRTEAGLTQSELAKLIRTTTPSIICRLEDADYQGHSLNILRRIAAALNRRVEIRFVPLKGKRKAA